MCVCGCGGGWFLGVEWRAGEVNDDDDGARVLGAGVGARAWRLFILFCRVVVVVVLVGNRIALELCVSVRAHRRLLYMRQAPCAVRAQRALLALAALRAPRALAPRNDGQLNA